MYVHLLVYYLNKIHKQIVHCQYQFSATNEVKIVEEKLKTCNCHLERLNFPLKIGNVKHSQEYSF